MQLFAKLKEILWVELVQPTLHTKLNFAFATEPLFSWFSEIHVSLSTLQTRLTQRVSQQYKMAN